MSANLEPVAYKDLKAKPAEDVVEATITPTQARAILRQSSAVGANFRKLSEDARVRQMVDAMRAGRWDWTDADPIRLHVDKETGALVATDGQHRLHAATVARRNLRTLILFGEQWIAGVHVDRNKARNVAQFLEHEYGLRGAAPFVALARYELARRLAYHERMSVTYAQQSLDDEAVIAYIVDNRNEIGWCLSRASTGGTRGFNVTAYGTMLYELLTISHESAVQFHEDLKDPDLEVTDPLQQLRRVVSRRYSESGLKAHREFTMANLVKAWNERQASRSLSKWYNADTDEVWFPAGYTVPKIQEIAT